MKLEIKYERNILSYRLIYCKEIFYTNSQITSHGYYLLNRDLKYNQYTINKYLFDSDFNNIKDDTYYFLYDLSKETIRNIKLEKII